MIIQGVDVTKLMSKMLSDIIPYVYQNGVNSGDIKQRIDLTFKKHMPEIRKIDLAKCNIDQLRALGFVDSRMLNYEPGFWAPQFWLASAIPEGTKMYLMQNTSKTLTVNSLGYNIFPQGTSTLMFGLRRASQDENWGSIRTDTGIVAVPAIMAELLSMSYSLLVSPMQNMIEIMRSAIMRVTYQFQSIQFSDLTIYQLNYFGCMKIKDKTSVYIPMWLLRLMSSNQVIHDVFNHNATTNTNPKLLNEQREGWACYYIKYGVSSSSEVVNSNHYTPKVMINISSVQLSEFDKAVALAIAANMHYSWVKARMKNGWRLGNALDDGRKTDPRLRPFNELDKETKKFNVSAIADTILFFKASRVDTGNVTDQSALKKVQQFMKSVESNQAVGEDGVMRWTPKTLNLNSVVIPPALLPIAKDVMFNKHEYDSAIKMKAGWVYGEKLNNSRKVTPMLVPFDALPASEKNYLQTIVSSTIQGLIACGVQL
jgi:hypothetical protein